jgi:hypothetical protein
MSIDWNRLTAPFPPRDIEWKPGAVTRDKKKGLAMAYITARAVQERLDEVFGPGNWKNEFRQGPEGGVLCRIYFKNDEGEWVWREDGADNTEVEAVKGGLSNAMKRAGAALGIGRYLYDLPAQWVPLDDRGRFAETPRVPGRYLPRQAPSSERSTRAGAPRNGAPRAGAPRNDASRNGTPREGEPPLYGEAPGAPRRGKQSGGRVADR